MKNMVTLIDRFRNAIALWINVLFDMCDSSNISSSIIYFFVSVNHHYKNQSRNNDHFIQFKHPEFVMI